MIGRVEGHVEELIVDYFKVLDVRDFYVSNKAYGRLGVTHYYVDSITLLVKE